MKREIEIKATPKEIAEMLFNLDNYEVAEMFSHWKKLFDDSFNECVKNKKTAWVFDLNHFMMHVIPELDEDGKDFFRSAYATMIYNLVDNVSKKHLIDINY